MTRDDRVAAIGDRSPGEDPVDRYADVDDLPDWWREAVEEFESHGLRPYRPPRFADGALKHRVVEALERELDVEIRFVCTDVGEDSNWDVRVDGEPIVDVGHHRDPDGYSVFELDSADLASAIRDRIDG